MFWRKKRPLSDFQAEIESHLAHEADEGSHDGARRAFGNVTRAEESFHERGQWLAGDRIVLDLRHAARMFWRKPGFSAVAVLTLALGIGANTAIFSVVHAVLWKPLPYKDPDHLAMLWSEDSAHGLKERGVSRLNFADWKSRSHTFQDLTAYIGQTFLLGNNDGSPERMRSARVSSNFFALLGVEPWRGRVFSPDEENRGERVVVLSYRLWQKRFAGNDAAVGSDLVMDGRRSRIIGVMPESFQFPFADTQVWEPVTAHPYWARDWNSPRSFSPSLPARGASAALDPDVPLWEIKTLDRVINGKLIGLSYVAVMLSVLGANRDSSGASSLEPDLRRQCYRCRYLWRVSRCGGSSRADSLLFSGPQGDVGRSDCRASPRITRRFE
jgi:hypothetical protein